MMRSLNPSLFSLFIAMPVVLAGCDDDTDTPAESDSTSMDSSTGAETAEPATSSSTDPGTTTGDPTTDASGDSSSGDPSDSESSTGSADMPPTTLNQAVNSFQNAMATMGATATVDSQGPVEIADGVELPGFAFGTYDVDVTADSITMTLVADPADLMITIYDDTTFDRYYYEFDQEIAAAELGDSTDANFAATVEILAPGTTVMTDTTFVEGLPTEWTFENGAIQITIGEGTDLNEISNKGGSLTVEF